MTNDIDDLQVDIYGDERRRLKGVLARLELAEADVEEMKRQLIWIKAFMTGLLVGVGISFTIFVALWQALQKLP
ncbi:MAG: hypothetical protein DWQ07_12695 [Chloroflexi bacterium]|nr:MAG: hypothetical protein DWQ07_12695 [Chloroflexota bacterium]MBL1196896.1 hypothetical protein [Chloroflexota bacterium]NOH14192.1 hypothetical protein [Chloroflexota bacterium]